MNKYLIYNEIERNNGSFSVLARYEKEFPLIGANHFKLENVKILNNHRLQISFLKETYILKRSLIKKFEAEDDDSARLIFECGNFV